jgi:copper transport protein
VILGSLGIGLVSAIVSLGLQGVDLLNLPVSGFATRAPWLSALATSLGLSMLIAIAAMLVAASWRSRIGSAVAMVGVGLALAASGHAATASPQWLTRPAVFIHGAGLAYWIGAFVPLATMAWHRNNALPQVLKRFSSLAVPTVGLIALSGLVLAIIQLDSFGALLDTRYGNILALKLGLVFLLLVLAALNRFVFTPAVARDVRNARPLLRSVLAECVLAIAILGLVSGWRFTPPPRALVLSTEAPLAVHIHTDAAMFQVLIAPGKVGENDFVLQLMNGDGGLLAAKEATLTLSLPGRGIEPMERSATLGPDAYWHVGKVALPFPGRWHMRIDALVTDFKKVTLEDDFEVR